MTIDLGGTTQKTCKQCGMEYVPSNAEDAKLHRKFHDARVGGVDVPKGLVGCVKVVRKCERCRPSVVAGGVVVKGGSEVEDSIVEIGRRDGSAARNAAWRVLRVVEEELGAVRTEEEDLWGLMSFEDVDMLARSTSAPVVEESMEGQKPAGLKSISLQNHERHKVYLYLQNNKCLGLCLVERIRAARPVLPSKSPKDSNIVLGNAPQPADLGISRIWVTNEFRRGSIAQRMLDAAQKSFMPGHMVEKQRVAFSQPTTSGASLARKWLDREDGWLVYSDDLRQIN